MYTAQLSLLVNILNSNEFSSDKDHVVHPVVLDGVVILVSLEVFPDVSANTLVNASGVPGQLIHNNLFLKNESNYKFYLNSHISGDYVTNGCLQLQIFSKSSGLDHVIDFRAGLLPVAKVTNRVSSGKGLETENVILFPNKNLISERESPFTSPNWFHRVRVGVRTSQGSAGGQLYLLIVAAVRYPAHPLAGTAGGIIVLLVTPVREKLNYCYKSPLVQTSWFCPSCGDYRQPGSPPPPPRPRAAPTADSGTASSSVSHFAACIISHHLGLLFIRKSETLSGIFKLMGLHNVKYKV